MVQVSPDTYNEGWDWCSGYPYSDSSIMGSSPPRSGRHMYFAMQFSKPFPTAKLVTGDKALDSATKEATPGLMNCLIRMAAESPAGAPVCGRFKVAKPAA